MTRDERLAEDVDDANVHIHHDESSHFLQLRLDKTGFLVQTDTMNHAESCAGKSHDLSVCMYGCLF